MVLKHSWTAESSLIPASLRSARKANRIVPYYAKMVAPLGEYILHSTGHHDFLVSRITVAYSREYREYGRLVGLRNTRFDAEIIPLGTFEIDVEKQGG